MTDSLGRRIDFKNAIIIMTSNIGSRQLKDFGLGVGFATAARETAKGKHSQSVIENALKRTFAPEFLNRIDDIVIFDPLEREDIHKIIEIELGHLYKRVKEIGYTIEISEKAKDFIVEKGWDAQYGARPLKRAIQKYVEDPLAEEIIKTTLTEGDHILVDSEEGKEELTIGINKKEVAVEKQLPAAN
jgi:ATP-dependent Clp protease ATP-binding subunit ClpC